MELRDHYLELLDAGAEVVSLAVASLEDVESLCQQWRIDYPALADANHKVAEAYGVYNLHDDGVAGPAVFIVDTDRRIVWRHIAKNTSDPAFIDMIVEHLP